MSATIKRIQKAFAANDLTIADEQCAVALRDLCNRFNMPPDVAATKFDAFSFAKCTGSTEVTMELFAQFENEADFTLMMEDTDEALLSQLANGEAERPTQENDAEDNGSSPVKSREVLNSDIFASSQNKRSPVGAAAAEKYAGRENSGKVECTLNEHLAVPTPNGESIRTALRCKVEVVTQVDKKFMYTKPDQRREAIDERISEMSEHIAKTQNVEHLAPVGVPSQGAQLVVGRVVCEAEGKLNALSVLLEGSTDTSNGRRVKMNVVEMPEFALFPGQVVGVEGVDATGMKLVAQRIIPGDVAPMAKTPADDLIRYSHGRSTLKGEPLSIMAACGPFTLSTDLDFKPLNDLLDEVQRQVPDVLVLMGPFVDTQHPMIKAGDLDQCFDQVFTEKVKACLIERFQTLPMTILVPSTRDAFHTHVVPQPAFDMKLLDLEELAEVVIVAPNPVNIKINEVNIGIMTSDVLLHLSGEEVARTLPGAPVDRMGRLAEHLLQQRSYYPLYPAPVGHGVDLGKADKLHFDTTPDVLIVPSDLKFFAKTISDCVVVNPGRLTKGTTAGTYTRMVVHPVSKEELEPKKSEPVAHSVATRMRADVVRI